VGGDHTRRYAKVIRWFSGSGEEFFGSRSPFGQPVCVSQQDLVKVLWWDRDGLAIYYKRLERGEFPFPRGNTPSIKISSAELLRLLSGMSVKERKGS